MTRVLFNPNLRVGEGETMAGFEDVQVEVDPNVRVRGNQTYSCFRHVRGADLPAIGDPVQVVEPESGLTGTGTVTDLDHEAEIIYIRVDWRGLRLAR